MKVLSLESPAAYDPTYKQCWGAGYTLTAPLKGNVALALHSTARSSRIKHSILALNAHSASESRVVNHSRLVRVLSIASRSSLGLMPTASSGE